MMTNLYVNTQAGFRGVSKISTQLEQNFNLKSVSFSCLRQWVLRLSYGILQMGVEKREDWIYIIDFSISLGKQKCLLILGTTIDKLNTFGYELKHENLCVLDIFVAEYFDSSIVYERLTCVKQKTGSPYQIVCDNGNDLTKGVELFCESNENTVRSYDVSHMIGICIKHSLEKDSQWLDLQADLRSLTQQVKQTDVSFLRPIALSKKARWLNIQNEIIWLENIYAYEAKNDFSLISTGFKISNVEEVFDEFKIFFNGKKAKKRFKKAISHTIFQTEEEFERFLIDNKINCKQNIQTINAGKARFVEKFNILDKHKKYFLELQELNEMTKNIKINIKEKGLSAETLEAIEPKQINTNWVKDICVDIKNRLVIENSKFKKLNDLENQLDKKPTLCCSDIIESIFGKFKMKINQSVGGIYSSVLSITLFCTHLTTELITEILIKIKISDVDKWFVKMTGRSNLAKRREAFSKKHKVKNKT